MTKAQFDKAIEIARSNTDLSQVDDTILDGCGLPGFEPVTVTLEAAAKFLRWQCVCLNGQLDSHEVNEMRNVSRRRWLIC
jgi:hypothetical protein